jgi:hypothetical protein
LRDTASEDLRDATESLEEMLRAQESNHRLREQIRQIEREIGNLQTDQRAETEKRERYQGEIKELKAGDVGKLNQSIAFAEEKRKGASSRLAELEETRTAEARLQQDLLRATEAEKEHQIAKAHTVLIKAIADLLKDKRESIIAEAFNKLLQVANMVVKSILKIAPRSSREHDREICWRQVRAPPGFQWHRKGADLHRDRDGVVDRRAFQAGLARRIRSARLGESGDRHRPTDPSGQ